MQRSTLTVLQLVIGATMLWAGLVWGQIYRWTDGAGQVHFTDNPSRIPPEYRANTTVYSVTTPTTPEAPTPSGEEAKAPAPLSAPPDQPQAAAGPRDRLGRGPEYWQARARQWITELQRHTAERDRLQLLYNYTRDLAHATRDVWDRGRLEAEVERLGRALADVEQRIVQARNMLHTTLPLEAIQLGANPEWLNEPTAPSR